jgi:hypothetical protein
MDDPVRLTPSQERLRRSLRARRDRCANANALRPPLTSLRKKPSLACTTGGANLRVTGC